MADEEKEFTTVTIKPSTLVRLRDLCMKDETYDKVLNELIDLAIAKEYLYNKVREDAVDAGVKSEEGMK